MEQAKQGLAFEIIVAKEWPDGLRPIGICARVAVRCRVRAVRSVAAGFACREPLPGRLRPGRPAP